MTAVPLDIRAWAWSLDGDVRLPPRVLTSIRAAARVLVSPITRIW